MRSSSNSRLALLSLLLLSSTLHAAPPANDAFASRIPITGTFPQTVSGTNVEATKESGEPFHWSSTGGRSVWWSWTAASTGSVTMHTIGSTFDTLLAVYTGTAVNALTLIANNDDASGTQSQVSFSATAGTTYQIAVDGYSSATGSISLTIQPPAPPPANDAFANRIQLSGAPTSVAATNVGATAESGEPAHASYTPRATVWWSWTAPATGGCQFQVTGSSFTSVMGIYTGTVLNSLTAVGSAYGTNSLVVPVVAGTTYQIALGGDSTATGTFTLNVGAVIPSPVNDTFAARTMLSGTPTSVTAGNQGATAEFGEPAHAGYAATGSVWWTWTAPSTGECQLQVTNSTFTSVMGIYTGTALNGLTQVGSAFSTNAAFIQVVAGTTYQIAVDGYPWSSPTTGSFTLNIGAITPPPANDAFAARSTLAGAPTSVTSANWGATFEAGEPSHYGRPANGSVWWTWTAPSSGECQFQVTNSTFTSVMGIYTGTALNSLTQVASAFTTNATPVQVVAGTTYQIAVGGDPYSSSTRGSFTLNIGGIYSPPANDAFAARSMLAGAPASVTAGNQGATVEAGEPSHAGYPASGTVWWTWTAPSSGECQFQVTNSNFNSVMGIYTGTALNSLAQVGSAYSMNPALVQVVAGTTYQIAVGGYPYAAPSRGSFTLNVGTVFPPPANDTFAGRQPIPTGLNLITGNLLGATKEAGEPFHGGWAGSRSVWYSWTAPATGECSILLTNAGFTPLLGIYTGSSVNALTQVAGASFANSLTFRVVAATTYHFAVDAYSGAGSFTLNLGDLILPPTNDQFAARVTVPTGPVLIQGTTQAATKEPGEPNHAGSLGGRSVWWSFTPSVTGECIITAYNATAFPPVIGVYTGTSVGSLVPAGTTSPGAQVAVPVTAGTTYHVAVDSSNAWEGGTFALMINHPLPTPTNDSFAGRTVLSGMSVRASGYNNAASKEAGEPAHSGNTGGKSVWYSWTAPVTGGFTLYLRTTPPFSYPLVGIYTGSSVEALTAVASTPAVFGTSFALPFNAVAGTTYQIAIDGSVNFPSSNSGSFLLNVTQPPANNAFASRINLGSVSNASSSSWVDLATTTESQEPVTGTFLARTIWWSWTAPSSGFYSIDTLGSDFDTLLQVYTGPGLGSLTFLMENQDADDQGRSRLLLNATAGTTYHFRVGGQMVADIGNVTLQINPLAAPVSASDHVLIGRAWLQRQTVAALGNADASFQAALAIDSNHPEANLLRAISRFARLEQGSAFQSALTGLGLVDGDLYERDHTLPTDANGDKIATPGTHTSHGMTFLVNTVLPELPLIRAHLDKATVPGFQTSLTDTESTYYYSIIDQGDISLIKASTYLMEAMIRLLQTFDTGVSVADLISQSNGTTLTAKDVQDAFSNLLGNTGNNQRTAFKTALQNANTHYQAGSAFIRTSRPDPADDKFLFFLPANAAATEAEARVRAQEASAALDGPATLAGESVDLSIAISSSQSLRDRLPGLVGNKAVSSTTPDATFGGAAPNMTQAKLNDRLRKLGILHEVSSFGNWTQHYLSSLPPGSQDKNDDPDGDMLSNFAEFAFNLDPAKGSSSSEFAVGGLETNVVDNKPYLNITFRRRIVRDVVSYIVAVSDNLISWDRTQAQVVQVGPAVPNADGITETVKFRVVADPDITERKFVRVEAVDLAP